MFRFPTLSLSIALSCFACPAWDVVSADDPLDKLNDLHGGLAVCVSPDSESAAWIDTLRSLHDDHGMLVFALHRDAQVVSQVQASLAAKGESGEIIVDLLTGETLPLINDSVNLLVLPERHGFAASEIQRVLAPRGTAIVGDGAQRIDKPWPDEIDEWTHYLHDPSNNAVADDDRIGPPRHLQWQCGPRWSRHHDHMASLSAMVTAKGRMFYILDEGSRVSPQLPSKWKLVARDAFNGVLLWKRDISQWQTALWPLKSGPANLPRRLVAIDDVVYATLGINSPVSAIDAATGQTLLQFAGSEDAEEIICQDGILLVLVDRTPTDYKLDLRDDPEEGASRDSRTTYSSTMGRIWAGVRSKRWSHGDRAIVAFDSASGVRLWQRDGQVIPLTLAAAGGQVYFHDGDKVVALDLRSGQPKWSTEPVPVWQGLEQRGLQSWFAPTLVVQRDKVLFAGGEKMHMSYMGWGSPDIGQDTMTAFSANSGEKLWTADHPYSGYNSPEDLFIIDGNVWTGTTGKGDGNGRYSACDLRTGEPTLDFPPTVDAFWFHHRCYRAKATKNYVLSSRTGIEFVDLKSGQWTINHWVRGGCLYGILPANGMVYAPPHPCACYPEAKLYGLNALAPARASQEIRSSGAPAPRLEKGPAYATSDVAPASVPPSVSAWPTYRASAARNGFVNASVSASLEQDWQVELGENLTPPVVADGRLLVADKDLALVHALDAKTGDRLWSYAVGGRVDTPPTIAGNRVVFGSANGYVYCLQADDGELAWRFRAAPADQRMVAFERVESVWPVHGAVLAQDGVVTFVAGRSMYLDGGLRLCRLDLTTGELLGEVVLDDRDPESGEDMQLRIKGLNMPVALPDILSSDGEYLYLRSQAMDLAGRRTTFGPGKTGPDHLIAPYGFTDDSWFHRTYWIFGDSFSGGVGGFGNGKKNPAARVMVHNDRAIYGFGRKPEYYRWCSAIDYQLFAAARPGGDRGAAQAVAFENTASLDPAGKALTVAAWVKTDKSDGTILVRGAQQNGFALIVKQGKLVMLLRTKGKTYQAESSDSLGSEWTHVAGTLGKDGRMRVFIDGNEVGASDDVPTLAGTPSIAMKVGYDDTNQLLPDPLTPFDGALDEVMLFYRDLSSEEIARLADDAALKLTDAERRDQVVYLDFSKGRVRDESPAGNHGSLTMEKAETTEGPNGDALVLQQPKEVAGIPVRRGGSNVNYLWARDSQLLVRAMALAGDTLLIAGPPKLLNEVETFQTYDDPDTLRLLAEQDEALDGLRGGVFQVVDTATGETQSELSLGSPPVFDGVIAADGRAYVVTMDGHVISLAGGRP